MCSFSYMLYPKRSTGLDENANQRQNGLKIKLKEFDLFQTDVQLGTTNLRTNLSKNT